MKFLEDFSLYKTSKSHMTLGDFYFYIQGENKNDYF